jgi:hypothetical protein
VVYSSLGCGRTCFERTLSGQLTGKRVCRGPDLSGESVEKTLSHIYEWYLWFFSHLPKQKPVRCHARFENNVLQVRVTAIFSTRVRSNSVGGIKRLIDLTSGDSQCPWQYVQTYSGIQAKTRAASPRERPWGNGSIRMM